MTDDEFDFDFEDEADTDVESENAEPVVDDKPKRRGRPPGKRPKHPLPTGWETPSDLAIRVNYEGQLKDENGEGDDIDGQTIYSYAGRDDALISDENPDGWSTNHTDGRLIVNVEKAIAWLVDRKGEMAERAAKRAAAAEMREFNRMRSLTKGVAALARS